MLFLCRRAKALRRVPAGCLKWFPPSFRGILPCCPSLSGVVAVGASGAGLWYLMPRNGVVHPLVTKPFFDSSVVIVIMGVFAVGLALIISGIY